MGVTGLWRLVEPAGKPVPVETLENKVLAVDISIWLHQVVKGYQDAKGAPLPNAHLIGLFQRLCKLLYFRIKPVFVFDGAFPELKKETIAKRQDSKNKYNSESERLKRELAVLLGKKTAIGSLLGKHISPTKKGNNADTSNDDLFKLPALPQKEESEPDELSDDEEECSSGSIVDLHSVDLQSDNFKAMPAKEKYDLLLELKETRKMNSWGKLHTLPKKSDNFSDFQMQRLLKRRKVQECIEETEKEMGDIGMSLNDLESLLNEEGIDTKIESLPTRRIASNNNTRFLLINNVKETLAKAKERKELENKPLTTENKDYSAAKNELEDDLQKAIQMSLECVDEPNTSGCQSKTDDSWTSVLTDTDYSEASDSEGELEVPDVTTAKAYIMQYSDYTHKAIEAIVAPQIKGGKKKPKTPKVNQIIKEISKGKSVIVDNVALSSSDEESDQECSNHSKTSNEVAQQHQTAETMEDLVSTQASVLFVENDEPSVISLDSSLEEAVEKEKEMNCTENIQVEDSESSDDDEFEEVPEVENKLRQPVVELTLNIDNAPEDDDDIFADIFAPKFQPNSINVSNITSDIKKKTQFEHFVPKVEPSDINVPVNKIQESIASNKLEDRSNVSVSIDHMHIKSINPTNPVQVQNIRLETTLEISLTSNKTLQNVDSDKASNNLTIDLSEKPKTSEETITHVNPDLINDSATVESNKPPKEPLTEEQLKTMAEEIQNEKRDLQAKASNNLTIDLPENPKTSKETIKHVNPDLIKDPGTVESNKPPKEPLTEEQLNTMAEEIQTEERDLMQEKGRLDRIGRNITEQMTKEAQELLQIFGIPYVVAPMEAEAQCAFLESVKLTDGTITDDSDIWLFGGQTVYKNFFNQKKHVLQYVSDRIERSFNLTREQLILLALLVGSDYTTGVTGVGPVTAMEILASFPFNKKQVLAETSKQVKYAKLLDGLKEFKLWVRAGKRTDNTSLKKKLRNVTLTDDFPSMRVVQAYLEPNVERSEEKFTWGELDITVLRDYAKSKFGWSQNKFDEIIKPVLARMKDRKNQKTVHDYFQRKVEFQTLEDQMSKRVKAAVQKMGPGGCIEENPYSEASSKTTRKRKQVSKNYPKNEAGSSKPKQKRKEAHSDQVVKVVTDDKDGKSGIEINIPKTDRFQEIIPQREKDKQHLLENKMKAIEIFRKTTIDRKRKLKKRKANLPKEDAGLSESSDSE